MHVYWLVWESHLDVVSRLLRLCLVGARVSSSEGLHSVARHLAGTAHYLLSHVHGRDMQFSLGFRLRCGAFLRRLLLRLGELAFFLSLLSLFLSVPFRYSPLQGQCLFHGVLLGFLRLQPFLLLLVGARLFQAVVLPGSGFCRCLMLAACRLCRGRRSCRNACFLGGVNVFLSSLPLCLRQRRAPRDIAVDQRVDFSALRY